MMVSKFSPDPSIACTYVFASGSSAFFLSKLVNPKIEELNKNIMGIAGLRKRCESRINNIPIKFKTNEWKRTVELEFLGRVIKKGGIAPDDRKIRAINEFPVLINIEKIRSCLGKTGFYIQDYSKITRPLTNLLKNGITFKWT